MSYENAPATKMLATHCAVCRRPLLDARSAEIGVGPDCRKKHGYDDAVVPEEAREVANQRINALARNRDDVNLAIATIAELTLLGFTKLCAVLTDRLSTVKIIAQPGGSALAVFTPYDEKFVAAIRNVSGRRWDKANKAWTVPAGSKAGLWNVIRSCFPGKLGAGPQGLFVIPQ